MDKKINAFDIAGFIWHCFLWRDMHKKGELKNNELPIFVLPINDIEYAEFKRRHGNG